MKEMDGLFPTVCNSSVMHVKDLFSAMAAADLLVMAVYFGGLPALLSWGKLRRLFPGRQKEFNEVFANENHADSFEEKRNVNMSLSFGLTVSVLVWFIVELSLIFERFTCHLIPGMCCAAVAVLGTIVRSLLDRLITVEPGGGSILRQKMCHGIFNFERNLKYFGPRMSDICFLLVFASIGTSANIGTALAHGLPCFVFAIFSLCVHILTIGIGSLAAMKIFPSLRYLSLEEVLVASNAAIGGASTAATFAATMSRERLSFEHKRGLILAATICGILGYAFATTIGVVLTKFLVRYI